MKKLTMVGLGMVCLVVFLSNTQLSTASKFLLTDPEFIPNLPDPPINYPHLLRVKHQPDPETETDDSPWQSNPTVVEQSINFNGISIFGATLGRVLFYDKKLSSSEKLSCGSCHIQELSFADNAVFSEGANELTKRNSLHLNDLGWSNNEHFSWSMKHKDLKSMIKLPLLDENEIDADIDDVIIKMYETDYYPKLFKRAFNSNEISEEKIVKALFQFISTMNTFNSKFDIGRSNNFEDFSESEKNGMALFNLACESCHGQGTLRRERDDTLSLLDSKSFLFFNGIEDFQDEGAGELDPKYQHHFKVPTLKNIALTAPYMHDGRFETLEEVIDHYSDLPDNVKVHGIPWGGFDFRRTEKEDLLAFLHTLTDPTFATNEAWSDPFVEVVGDTQMDIVLYPNPMSEEATLKYHNPNAEQMTLSIFDVSGKLVQSFNSTSNQVSIKKAGLISGIYTLQLNSESISETRKLVIR